MRPRRPGKTTLVRHGFSHLPYVSLEDPSERAFAQEDPRGFLARFATGAVFDETQPLAGRAAVLKLWPLPWDELSPHVGAKDVDDVIIRGGYPTLAVQPGLAVQDWMANYVAACVERDVRQVLRVQVLSSFQRSLRLCAGRVGQLLNLTALANEAGVAHTTARQWLTVLEASQLVTLLAPYHRNFGKRLVRTPKLYMVDTGLACWLLGIRSAEQLALHPQRGALFENWVVTEFVKARLHRGLQPDLRFWRDNNGLEADLVFEVTTPQGPRNQVGAHRHPGHGQGRSTQCRLCGRRSPDPLAGAAGRSRAA